MKQEAEIILIEDNVSDEDLIMRALKKNNFDNGLLHLQDGKEALDYFFGQAQIKMLIPPKIILLDLKMPKVNGLELLERLKANEYTKTIPVVVLTSSKQNTDLQKAYQLGANSYLVKPVIFDEFIKVIAQLGLYWLQVNVLPKR